MAKRAILSAALLLVAAAAAAQEAPLRTEWQDVFEPRIVGFRPGQNTVLLAIEKSGRPVLIDMADPDRPILLLRLPPATAAAFVGPERFATGHADGAIRLWTTDGRAAGTPLPSGGKPIEALVSSPSGRAVASLDADRALTLWAADFGKRFGPLEEKRACNDGETEPSRPIIAFSPDEKLIAAVTQCSDVGVWTADGRAVPVPKRSEPHGTAYSLAFARDGTTLAVQSKGQPGDFAHYWPVANGRLGPARKFPPALFNTYLSDLVTGRAADALIAATLGHVLFLSPQGAVRALLPAEARLLTVSADGTRLGASSDYRIALWDAARRPLAAAPFHDLGRPFAVAASPDGRLVAAGDGETLGLWHADGKPAVGPIALGPTGQRFGEGLRLAFAEDGKSLWMTNKQGYVQGFTAEGKPLGRRWRVPGHGDEDASDRPTPILAGDRILAVDGGRKNLVAFDRRGGRPGVRAMPLAHPYRAIAASADGRHIALAYPDYVNVRQIVHVHAAAGGERLATLAIGPNRSIDGLEFSPDGATIVTLDSLGSGAAWRWSERGATPFDIGAFLRFTDKGEILAARRGQAVLLRADGSIVRSTWIGIEAKLLAASADGARALIDDGRGAAWRALDGAVAEAPSGLFRRSELRIERLGPEGEVFAHFSDGTFLSLTPDGASRRSRIPFVEQYSNPTGSIAPDGRFMAFAAGDNVVALPTDGSDTRAVLRGSLLGFAPGGDAILTAIVPNMSQREHGDRIRLRRYGRDGAPRGEIALPPDSGPIIAVAGNDGAIAVAAKNTVVLLDANGAPTGRVFAPLPDPPRHLAFAPGGEWLAALDDKGRLHRWRRDGSALGTPPASGVIREIKIAADGRLILAHTADERLLLLRVEGDALLPVGEARTPFGQWDGFGLSGAAVWHLDDDDALVLRDLALRPVLRLLLRSDGHVAQLPDGRYCGAGPVFETRRVFRGTAPATADERGSRVDCAAVGAAWRGLR
jgi:WD40 repeat protein